MQLHVRPNIYRRPFPRFDSPLIIGYIGLENLKYARRISNDSVNFDLNLHLDKVIKSEDRDLKLKSLLEFLLEHERRLNFPFENTLEKAKFFSYKGLMTCVACTPYENQEPWKIAAILFKGTIYLCARDTENKRNRRLNMTERDKRFSSWGHKFEQYLLSDEPDSEPNPDVPMDETKAFSLVFTTQLNSHKIVYGAEMDGIRCDKAEVSKPPTSELGSEAIVKYLSTKEFINLKTNRHIENSRQETSFWRYKSKKWWCQSFFSGVGTILCGYRNDDGIVEKLKTWKIEDLEKTSQRFWNRDVCLNFLDNFLIYVKQCLAREIKLKHGEKELNSIQELPIISLLFEWTPGQPVQVAEHYSHQVDPILMPWFTDNYGKVVNI